MELMLVNSIVIWALVAGLVLYTIGIAIYRIYFHPLAKFPGPKLAAASMWYEFYHNIIIHGGMMYHLQELHDKYGPVVRLGPNEVHIRDAEFYDELYSMKRKLSKLPDWNVSSPLATVATVDHEHHRIRRSALNPFFSKRNIVANEPQIKEKLNRFFNRIQECNDQVIRIDAAYMALTMDIITVFAFDMDHHHLDQPNFNMQWKDAILGTLAVFDFLRLFPWMMPVLKAIPLPVIERLNPSLGLVIRWQIIVRKEVDDIIARNKAGKRAEGTIFQAVLDSDLAPEEKEAQRLEDESNVVVGAGSETTARALQVITFFLLTDRTKLKTLRDEIATIKVEDDGFYAVGKLEKLPYLTACIMEGLRYTMGVTTRLMRTSNEAIRYQDWIIPPGTTISVMNYIVHTDEKIFPNPLEWRPERWIEAEQKGIKLDKYLVSFGKGTRQCIGINLAFTELYLTLAHTMMKFNFELYDTTWERDVRIDRDEFFGVPSRETKGIRVRVVEAL